MSENIFFLEEESIKLNYLFPESLQEGEETTRRRRKLIKTKEGIIRFGL